MKNLIFKISILIFCLFFTSFCDAQTKKRSLFKKGNKLFIDSIYEESEINYRKSLEQDQEFFKAKYNLANSVFKQERFDESESLYNAIQNQSEVEEENNKVQYNLATSQLKQNKFNEAIENYKKYIKKNPQDKDAIYNYCYAKKMLEQQQDKQEQQQDKQEQQQDKQEQQQDKQEQQQDKQEQQQDKQEQQQDKQEQQPDMEQMSKEDIENLLNAIQNQEKETKEKLQKNKKQKTKRKITKDW
ncbi:MAG: hypothetical protein CMP71_02215 [Flavobacteriales bacterium]|nr:hypothetical protein [Flavobacteriales bacterium]